MEKVLRFSDKEQIAKYVSRNSIRILNLCHVPEEGRLKTLSFSISDVARVSDVFDFGERVDGSSLFSSIPPGRSDIYLAPRIDRAFINPFAALPTLNVLCDYLDEDGKPLEAAPKTVMNKAEKELVSSTSVTLTALAELEFYIMSKYEGKVPFQQDADRNYHESAPFSKFEDVRNEILATLDLVGIGTKYGHGEVGATVLENGTVFEQHEIELQLRNLSETAENIAIAKWVIRNVCVRHGVSVSFSPKIALENAGTGMHIHVCALRANRNVVAKPDGLLSEDSLKIIGGILRCAQSLSAFGNPTPISYLRFVARKETPMHVCWSGRNRLALIRIPLWWSFIERENLTISCRQTFEYRAPDAFANTHLLFAGIAAAARFGLENGERAMKIAEKLHMENESRGRPTREMDLLPRSCAESAANLRKDRKLYESNDVFSEHLIDSTIKKLEAYNDRNLWQTIAGKKDKIDKLVGQYLDYG